MGLAAGPSVAIMDDAQRLLPAGATGEIVIRGENVTAGYASHPRSQCRRVCRRLVSHRRPRVIDDEGYLYITGRLKEIINRGGEKVSPREVDQALLEHSAVRRRRHSACRMRRWAKTSPPPLCCKDGATATEEEIRAFLFGRLAEFKIPSRLVVVDTIPLGATGKVQRARPR